MNQEERKEIVETKIDLLIKDFRHNPDKFLTEEDLRSYLYHLLLDNFNNLEQTKDNSRSISLHCEVRWYGEEQNLRFRSDIVIFDVLQLITTNEKFDLPTKGYGFNNPYIIIEIKLRRKKGKSDNQFEKALKRDRYKLNKIRAQIPTSSCILQTYLIGFDKKSNIHFETQMNENHKEYYISCDRRQYYI